MLPFVEQKWDNLHLIIKAQSFLALLTKIFVTPQLLLASNINWKMIFFFLCKSEQFFSKVLFITNERFLMSTNNVILFAQLMHLS